LLGYNVRGICEYDHVLVCVRKESEIGCGGGMVVNRWFEKVPGILEYSVI